jgi:hypothetical protein
VTRLKLHRETVGGSRKFPGEVDESATGSTNFLRDHLLEPLIVAEEPKGDEQELVRLVVTSKTGNLQEVSIGGRKFLSEGAGLPAIVGRGAYSRARVRSRHE